MTTTLILPQVPDLSSFDLTNLRDITSPDANCVKDMKVVLAGFDSITDDFMVRNQKVWKDKGESWPTEADYKLDGMTLYVEMMVSDTNAVAVCIQKGVVGSEADYTCFGLSYSGAENPKVT